MSKDNVKKPWGYEEIWAKTDVYVGKVIFIEPGHRLSKQFHEKKEETVFVLDGILLNYDKNDAVTRYFAGDSLHIKPGQVHRFGATELQAVTLIEVSTNHLDDVIRLEEDYGR